MVCFFSVAASQSMRTETLEDEPEVSEVPGHWNKLKKQIRARIPKPGETPSSITLEWLIYKIRTDTIAAQDARNGSHYIISYEGPKGASFSFKK